MQSKALSWDTRMNKEEINRILLENKVILAPSDTVWGLCGVVSQEVFDELNKLKVRNKKPYLILAQSFKIIQTLIELPADPAQCALVESFWPGPLTVIFKANRQAPAYCVSPEGTIAFRVVKHKLLEELLESAPLLFSTSANITGCPVPSSFQDIDPSLVSGVAACVVDDQSMAQSVVPSTIIDLSQGQLRLIREGAIPFDEIKEKLESLRTSLK